MRRVLHHLLFEFSVQTILFSTFSISLIFNFHILYLFAVNYKTHMPSSCTHSLNTLAHRPQPRDRHEIFSFLIRAPFTEPTHTHKPRPILCRKPVVCRMLSVCFFFPEQKQKTQPRLVYIYLNCFTTLLLSTV